MNKNGPKINLSAEETETLGQLIADLQDMQDQDWAEQAAANGRAAFLAKLAEATAPAPMAEPRAAGVGQQVSSAVQLTRDWLAGEIKRLNATLQSVIQQQTVARAGSGGSKGQSSAPSLQWKQGENTLSLVFDKGTRRGRVSASNPALLADDALLFWPLADGTVPSSPVDADGIVTAMTKVQFDELLGRVAADSSSFPVLTPAHDG